MSDDLEPLSAASLCRVYAAAGVPVVWDSVGLLRFAKLLDEHKAECDKALQRADAVHRAALRVYWRALGLGVVLLTFVCGLWVWEWLYGG